MNSTEQDNGWQPIKTAPKDGTRVLVYIPALQEWPAIVELSYFHKTVGSRGYWWNLAYLKPTHWRPLPEPPGGNQ